MLQAGFSSKLTFPVKISDITLSLRVTSSLLNIIDKLGYPQTKHKTLMLGEISLSPHISNMFKKQFILYIILQ
jgi:hypothetical protein